MNWNPDVGIPLAIAGVLIFIAIAVLGRPRKPDQGRRVDATRQEPAVGSRREPHFGADGEPTELRYEDLDLGRAPVRSIQDELELLDQALADDARDSVSLNPQNETSPEPSVSSSSASTSKVVLPSPNANLGRRGEAIPQRIVTLFVSAREGQTLDGASIFVAAEKAGLVYGHMGIFHRLVDGHPEAEPIFSVANLVKPGHFDLRNVHDIETPGLTFFMTLPGPMTALEAWETMQPTAQRMAELLDAVLLDEQHNTLGRQRISHIRDELRSFDREQEKESQRRW